MFDPNSAGPETDDGEQAALDLLTHGTLEIEGRLVDASNATLYCTITTGGPDPRVTKNPKTAQAFQNTLPVQMVDPIDVSRAVLYLVGESGRYVTGIQLPVDAGITYAS